MPKILNDLKYNIITKIPQSKKCLIEQIKLAKDVHNMLKIC